VIAPVFVFAVVQSMGLEFASVMMSLMLVIPELYPLSMNVFVLCYIPPYREYFLLVANRMSGGLLFKRMEHLKVVSVFSTSRV
jgi:hypothetical protein